MEMVQTYELITPIRASKMLESNLHNRKMNDGTVQAYANDIKNHNWSEQTASAIAFDENGVLRDGQHRLAAIVRAGIGIHTWICWNVSANGIYDNNRKRSNADQIAILRTDYDAIYRSTRYVSMVRVLITKNKEHCARRKVTPNEIINFTDNHKADLDEFFSSLPDRNIAKITRAVIYVSMFMAYCNGIKMKDIIDFFNVLTTGMSTKPEEFPIIAYRNYLKDTKSVDTTNSEIGRCQYAIKNYLAGNCIRRSMSPKQLIYPFPYEHTSEIQ